MHKRCTMFPKELYLTHWFAVIPTVLSCRGFGKKGRLTIGHELLYFLYSLMKHRSGSRCEGYCVVCYEATGSLLMLAYIVCSCFGTIFLWFNPSGLFLSQGIQTAYSGQDERSDAPPHCVMQNSEHTSISMYPVMSVHSDHPKVQAPIDDFLPPSR